jgi:hypothetical protein
MRRGIATFGFLARLAPAALAVGLLAGYIALRPPAPFCECDLPAAATPLRSSALELRGSSLHMPRDWTLDLTGAALVNVKVTGDLNGADLEQARLQECDLRAARLEGARIRGALYDRGTRWPEGFDR